MPAQGNTCLHKAWKPKTLTHEQIKHSMPEQGTIAIRSACTRQYMDKAMSAHARVMVLESFCLYDIGMIGSSLFFSSC